jgi:L,D-transpeptidase YcbB
MKELLHSRVTACVAAVGLSLGFAGTPVGAQSDTQQNDTPQLEAPEQKAADAPDFGPQTARATEEAAHRYAEIAASGGWPRVAKAVGPGAKGKVVLELRRRLAAEDFLSREDASEPIWDEKLEGALKRFQSHMGLEPTGSVSSATLRELNIAAAERARQLEATAKRLSKMKFDFGERYVDVNIPAATVESAENGQRIGRYIAVVGGRNHPSPQLSVKIDSIEINPAWTVPASIIKNELAPLLRRSPNALTREHIRIFDARGHEIDPRRLRGLSGARAAAFTFRQDPGPKNALGSLRIAMPNKDEVFLHDTPSKELFERDYRFLSHGCVRVNGVYELASWLLQRSGEPHQWDQAALRKEVDVGKTETIRLQRPVPVAWVYMTGWASPDGTTQFRRDIYNLDKGTPLPPTIHGGQVGASFRARPSPPRS